MNIKFGSSIYHTTYIPLPEGERDSEARRCAAEPMLNLGEGACARAEFSQYTTPHPTSTSTQLRFVVSSYPSPQWGEEKEFAA